MKLGRETAPVVVFIDAAAAVNVPHPTTRKKACMFSIRSTGNPLPNHRKVSLILVRYLTHDRCIGPWP
jgi:hypothetical protein